MSNHAWCRDVARDAAVRAAEDGRDRPLPTLEECIERQKKTARPCGGTDPAPSRGERGAADTGMRTERVTLEVTHGDPSCPAEWSWTTILRLKALESVSVVEETHFDDLAQVAMERDAAIRERDEAKARVAELEGCSWVPKAERDSLQARVAELEAASGGGEPVAYFVKWADKDWAVQDQTFRTRERAQDYINDEKSEDENPQIVPLYRAPPQPRGWLSEEERKLIEKLRDEAASWSGLYAASGNEEAEAITSNTADGLDALLSRSTPPEVVKPGRWRDDLYDGDQIVVGDQRDAEWLAALAAAGVAVADA